VQYCRQVYIPVTIADILVLAVHAISYSTPELRQHSRQSFSSTDQHTAAREALRPRFCKCSTHMFIASRMLLLFNYRLA
jgi:hypothetical protein